jgi:hypothetical protein
MGMRRRILNLALMVAFVLSLICPQLGSVSEALQDPHRHGLLWSRPALVSQQAISQRFRLGPHVLTRRPLPFRSRRIHNRTPTVV